MARLTSWVAAIVAATATVATAMGCEPDETTTDPSTTTGAGADQPHDGGVGGAEGGGEPDGGIDPDAGASPVLLGLTPNPAGAGGGEPSAADLLAAELTTYAVGVRSVVVARRWDELYGANPGALAADVADYRARGLAVVLDLLVVDRFADGRPVSLSGVDWDHSAMLVAMDETLDTVLAAVGPELHALVLGRETEQYLTAHPSEEVALGTLLQHASTHARTVQPELPTGVGVSVPEDPPSATVQALLTIGELAALSYFPGRGEPQLPTDISATLDMDGMIAAAADKPIVLLASGHTSSAALAGTPEGQQQFFEAFFGALAARRSHFDVVNIQTLHDRAASACAAYAASNGEPADGPFAQYACAGGLKAADGTAKPAWSAFLQGAAAFASP